MTRLFVFASLILFLPITLLSWMVTLLLDYYTIPMKYDGPAHPLGNIAPYPGETAENLWWFIHISDIHISRFRDPSRTTDFQTFCEKNIDVIKPPVVVVTGDLTDAKTANHIGSTQQEIEWKSYQSAIKLARAHEKTKWIDIRGNHDAFDVPHQRHKTNYYRAYSIAGEVGDSSFIYQHKLPFGTYSFVSIHAILDPGPRRPFNFFGVLSEVEMEKVKKNTLEVAGSNQTIFFGHYTTSAIYPEKPGISEILQNGIAYLCGHLHSLGGMVRNMKALQKTGSLELEVEDWKENRMYRVMAFDHDILSFVDIKFNQWPVVLITNPKRARFMSPRHEPIKKMLHSTHIRFLVFSPSPIAFTEVRVDGQILGAGQHVEGPLYVAPWDPRKYGEGLHLIEVTATDEDGNTMTSKYHFSVDGSRPDQWFVPAVILMSDMIHVILLLYVVLLATFSLPLIFLRWASRKGQDHLYTGIITRGSLRLAHTDFYFYSIMWMMFYPLIGPWSVGEFIGEHIGISTMYGIYINGSFVGELFSYAVVLLDMTLFQGFFNLFLILKLGLEQTALISNGTSSPIAEYSNSIPHSSSNSRIFVHVVTYACLLLPFQWQWYSLKTLYLAYGTMALFISPKYLWTAVWVVYMIYKVHIKQDVPATMNGSHKS